MQRALDDARKLARRSDASLRQRPGVGGQTRPADLELAQDRRLAVAGVLDAGELRRRLVAKGQDLGRARPVLALQPLHLVQPLLQRRQAGGIRLDIRDVALQLEGRVAHIGPG